MYVRLPGMITIIVWSVDMAIEFFTDKSLYSRLIHNIQEDCKTTSYFFFKFNIKGKFGVRAFKI